MAGEFEWIAVRLTSTANAKGVGGAVIVGLGFGDQFENVEVPIFVDDADGLTIAEVRSAALKQATKRIRGMLEDLDGKSWEELSATEERQDREREEKQQREFDESLANVFKR